MLGSLVLVIDDNPKIKESLEFAFPEYKFIGVLSGEEGIELLRKPNEIDLVILDFKLGSLDGIEVLKQIKDVCPRVGVILLTAYGSKEMVIQALENRADDFMEKPYDVTEMSVKFKKFFSCQPLHDEKDNNYKVSIQRVIRLLEKNDEKFLTLQDASDLVMLSPKYISRLFKNETRMNFIEFRTVLKIRSAKKVLKNSSLTINQIAEKIGYQNPTSFVKMFKKATGVTPTEYRQKNARSF